MSPRKLLSLIRSIYSSPITLLLSTSLLVVLVVLLTSEQSFFVPNAEASLAEINDEITCSSSTSDLVSVQSQYDVPETVARLQLEIEQRGLGILSMIDYAGAPSVTGEPLRPTTLIMFDGPEIGASLLQQEQSVAMDLPLKFLVWQNGCDQVHIGYTAVSYLENRHKIRAQDETFQQIAELLESIALASAVSL